MLIHLSQCVKSMLWGGVSNLSMLKIVIATRDFVDFFQSLFSSAVL